MQRKPRIRYSAQDKRKLKALQQRVNNRIYYERSKGGDTSHLPDTVKLKDLESSIYSRSDYNFRVSQLNKMLERDAMEIVKTDDGREYTKGFQRQVSNAQRRENIKRYHKREKQRLIDEREGRVLGSELSDAYAKREFDLMSANPRYVDDQLDRIFKMSMDKYESDSLSIYQENYISGLIKHNSSQDEYGHYIITDKMQELIDTIREVDKYDFFNAYNSDKERYSLKQRYVIENTQDEPIEYLLDMWREFGVNKMTK